jgi:hypothetical protein
MLAYRQKLPAGHSRLEFEPKAQYDPIGHDDAWADVEPALQKNPAEHNPVAKESPELAQYEPAGQMIGSDIAVLAHT